MHLKVVEGLEGAEEEREMDLVVAMEGVLVGWVVLVGMGRD